MSIQDIIIAVILVAKQWKEYDEEDDENGDD